MTSPIDQVAGLVPTKWALAVKTLPFVLVLCLAKVAIDLTNAHFIELSTLIGSMVAAAVFLLGFLLAGTLADYKESERLPGELASSLETLSDECTITVKNKGAGAAAAGLAYVADLTAAIHRWFYRRERTRDIMEQITGLNDTFLAFEALTQPNFIVRMKQEQSNVRRIITRIDTIRDTSFVSSAYTIAELAVGFVLVGLILTKIEPLYEALFYIGVLGFFLVYLILLIRDLDNPFNYSETSQSADVSIKPIADLDAKLSARVGEGPPLPAAALADSP
jgi:hypothetical protein